MLLPLPSSVLIIANPFESPGVAATPSATIVNASASAPERLRSRMRNLRPRSPPHRGLGRIRNSLNEAPRRWRRFPPSVGERLIQPKLHLTQRAITREALPPGAKKVGSDD